MAKEVPHSPLSKKEFEELFRLHYTFLCNFARQYVGESEAAEDLTQGVFVTLWEKREEIDPQRSIKSLLFTMVKNRCLNYLRDQKKFQSQVLDIEGGDIDLGEEDLNLEAKELEARIEEALSQLPEKCRQVFEMSRYNGMKYKEIAEELDISPKTVEAHMSKAIKTLREGLQHYLLLLLIFWIFT